MLKQSVFTLTALLFLTTAFSQKIKKDSLLTLMATEVCTEITSNNSSEQTSDDLQIELGLALMPLFTRYQTELKEFFDVELTNSSAMEEFGGQIGMKLVTDCPYFLTMMKKNSTAFVELSEKSDSKNIFSGTINGTLIKIVPGDFTHFIVRNESGKLEKIWWQEYFSGSEKLSASNLNKPIKVTFVEKDIYSAVLEDYIKQKIATSVE